MKFTAYTAIQALLILLLSACDGGERGTGNTAQGDTPSRAAATMPDTTLLNVLHLNKIEEAFHNLQSYAFTRTIRTEQFNTEGERMAVGSRNMRYQPGHGKMIAHLEPISASGDFDFGFFNRFSAESSSADPSSLADEYVPEDPPYLSRRNWENFTYRTAADTLINGAPARILEISAVAEASEQPVRYARLYFEPESHSVVALYQVHSSPARVFHETTTVFVQVSRRSSGEWLPDLTSVSTKIRLPLTEPRLFRTTSRFDNFSQLQP